MPQLLYGKGHVYGNPLSGSGFESSVSKITRGDLINFHTAWFGANNAQVIIAGDITEAEIKPMLEKYLATWKPNEITKKNITEVAIAPSPLVYLIDMPDAEQTVISASLFSPSPSTTGYDAMQLMNTMLGGSFLSRLNMNLREDKHWSYWAFSYFFDTRNQGLFIASSSVQTDKTKESMVEMLKELSQINGDKPIAESEFKKEQTATLLEIPGRWETNGAIRNFLQYTLQYNKGLDYPNRYASIVQNLTLNDVRDAATKLIKPINLTWLLIGDRKKIEAGVRELNIGPLKILDKEGNEIK